MEFMTDPKGIETKSMEIIEGFLQGMRLTEAEKKVVKRVVHTTGDPEVAGDVIIHPDAIAAGLAALRGGASVITDVTMVQAGINKNKLSSYGGEVRCLIHDEQTVAEAKRLGVTRAMVATRRQAAEMNDNVVAIGNAPTALFELLRLIEEGKTKPALIIGVPVGFVGAKESKELLVHQAPVPFITLWGNKGGSNVAASIVNALLYME